MGLYFDSAYSCNSKLVALVIGAKVCMTTKSVMHDSDSGIGTDSGMIPFLAGIGIGIGIKKTELSRNFCWNRNRNRNQRS